MALSPSGEGTTITLPPISVNITLSVVNARQVSHHIHCNDDALDEDVLNAFPFLRFDPRLPKMWIHQWQHIYMWFTFPLLTVVFQFGDLKGLFDKRTVCVGWNVWHYD